jgi:hypothetical protein
MQNLIFAHEDMKKQPSKLLIIYNQHFFSLSAWLSKRPILGRNRNLIGSPCLLSTISMANKNEIQIMELDIAVKIDSKCYICVTQLFTL